MQLLIQNVSKVWLQESETKGGTIKWNISLSPTGVSCVSCTLLWLWDKVFFRYVNSI